ncbi:hypothetical protein [Nostocoides sp. HKS02]|uniref:hypothetical protein n=1 Tax=Nostocoides sp. HKS02 TaxID=1813880 RepID=UPI0012B4CA26|nr:hypothetical protein [Tetrasphaera sp. HKS02]QGN58855.1 hypothetical protein GKE56_14280 [Tetrasphaera sp. HKS02]
MIVRARKSHQQVRPVPVVGIPERIAYRAFTTKVLDGQPRLDRSQDAYRQFIIEPIMHLMRGRRKLRFGQIDGYVVESDFVAFYEYIGHVPLLAEVELRTSSVLLPRILVRFLTELQGRPFGLPQLLDPSDDLSEVYGRIVERELKRRGLEVWRYNDDFRMVAKGYDHAQAAAEALSEEARTVGLVLNEPKTRIVKFINYFWSNVTEPRTDADVEFKPELIEVFSEYGESEGDAATEFAHGVIDRLEADSDPATHLDPKKMTRSEARELSRAISVLTREADSYGLHHVPDLFEFVAQLGHRLGTYMAELQKSGEDISSVWDNLVGRAHQFNAWQRIWLVYVARMGSLLGVAARRNWVTSQLNDPDPLLRAEATLALAPYKAINFDAIDRAVRLEPEALLPWYALAARSIPNVNPSRLSSLKESHKLIELVLHKPKRATTSSPKRSAGAKPTDAAT